MNDTKPSPISDTPPIFQSLDRLNEQLCQLEDLSTGLETQLTTVLTPPHPRLTAPDEEKPEQENSHVAFTIDNYAARMGDVTNRLRELTERIEL
jgi:hypothetical protein